MGFISSRGSVLGPYLLIDIYVVYRADPVYLVCLVYKNNRQEVIGQRQK